MNCANCGVWVNLVFVYTKIDTYIYIYIFIYRSSGSVSGILA